MNLKKLFARFLQTTVEFGPTKARALIDIAGTQVKAGEFFTASIDKVNQLVANGAADPNAKESDVYGNDIPLAKHIDD